MFSMVMRRGLIFCLVCALAPLSLIAVERRATRTNGTPSGDKIDLFEGVKSGKLTAKLIPRDSREARVLIENKTQQPLTVKLPEAFAATPVLGQIGAGGRGTGTNTGGMQAMGGGMGMGMGGMGMGMGGMGMGGFMNIPPEKVGKLKVPCVCLEHGKAEPRAAVTYELKPFEQYSRDPRLKQVLKLLGRGKLNQRVAQAATWHLANHMSWQDLANKQIEHVSGPNEPYFSEQELREAMELVSLAAQMADEEKSRPSSERGAGERAIADDPIKY